MQIRKSAVRISTSEYILSHGHAPRGRGGWAFRLGSSDAEPTWIQGSLTYGEAKKIAVAQAAERGIDILFVCT